MQKIFSITNVYSNGIKHKIIYIFGIKFSVKIRKTNEEKIKKRFLKLQKRFSKTEKSLKNKKIINIAFMVSLVSMFPAQPLFEYFLKHKQRYNVKILIIPDFRFGIENAKKIQKTTYDELSKLYGESNLIVCPIEKEKDKTDIKKIADIIIPTLPYDVSHKKYNLRNLIKLKILPAYINYGYFRSKYDRELISSGTYSSYWKIFVENEYNLQEYKDFEKINGLNCVLAGYCKMDLYKNDIEQTKEKKTVMIAPHHSVEGGFNDILSLSNFYKYAEFFLDLPKLYPNINFIFRPHPALFLCLEKEEFWGSEKVKKYIDAMKNMKNVKYSEGGNYLNDFAESDALIQDCGSFLVDYFYTKKPQCYMLKNTKQIDETFSTFGKCCLDNVYRAFEKKDIINFINNVVINENDFMKEKRENFAQSKVMLNYPNVAHVIGNYFNQIFGE